MEKLLKEIFARLDKVIEEENLQRREQGALPLKKSKVIILGQTSLLLDKKLSAKLDLLQTADLDAKLEMENFVKKKLQELLKENGLVYDEDSEKVFIPKGSMQLDLFDFKNIAVKRLDSESVIVSKAVKAPEKNRQLVQSSVVQTGMFENLISRIEAEGGDLNKILGKVKK
jgi:phage antirepressor YoqD-like protein